MSGPVRVDLWVDVVCPFCWIGKRRLEEASARAGIPVDVRLHAFELDPGLRAPGPLADHLARKFGSLERVRVAHERVSAMGAPHGLAFDWPRAIAAPTRDAHRLVLHAQRAGLGNAMEERLMRAHFAEGADVSDRATLLRLAAEVGVEGAEALLAGDDLAEEVRADQDAARRLGVAGVPFFVVAGRYGISGAQPVEVLEQALRLARG